MIHECIAQLGLLASYLSRDLRVHSVVSVLSICCLDLAMSSFHWYDRSFSYSESVLFLLSWVDRTLSGIMSRHVIGDWKMWMWVKGTELENVSWVAARVWRFGCSEDREPPTSKPARTTFGQPQQVPTHIACSESWNSWISVLRAML